jgi:hypothetical protein
MGDSLPDDWRRALANWRAEMAARDRPTDAEVRLATLVDDAGIDPVKPVTEWLPPGGLSRRPVRRGSYKPRRPR